MKKQREFVLAASIFVAAAVLGTGFALMYVANYSPTSNMSTSPR